MRSNVFKEAKSSVYIFSIIVILTILFYLFASIFTSMGFKYISNEKEALSEENEIRIVLDAGHGGEDPGAEANGLKEKDLNLDIVLRIKDLLVSNGYSVTLTRQDDSLLYSPEQSDRKKHFDLRNRVDIGNASEADAFVSVHMNKYPVEYCKGLQVFYTDKNKSSAYLASCIQDNVKDLQSYNKRQIKKDNDTIYLINNLEIPSVLVECVFLSNTDEAKNIKDEDYRKALAVSIYCGIAEYMESLNEN